MKFECEKTLLASAIDGVSRAITNRAAIPVLEGIYMKAEGFNLTLDRLRYGNGHHDHH